MYFFFEIVHVTVVGGLNVKDVKFRNTVAAGDFVNINLMNDV